jgi:hypothetical protein
MSYPRPKGLRSAPSTSLPLSALDIVAALRPAETLSITDYRLRAVVSRDGHGGGFARNTAGANAHAETEEKAVVEDYLDLFAARFPALMCPITVERGMLLSWPLERSEAGNGAAVVVGVAGKGRVASILRLLDVDDEF